MKYETKLTDGYMGSVGFEGCNSHLHLSMSEINKVLKKEFKNKYGNGFKIRTRAGKGWYGSTTVSVLIKPNEIKSKSEFVNEYCLKPSKICYDYEYVGLNNLELKILLGKKYDEIIKSSYYINECVIKKSAIDRRDFCKLVLNSFNYDESNAQVDYFSRGFYDHYEFKLEKGEN